MNDINKHFSNSTEPTTQFQREVVFNAKSMGQTIVSITQNFVGIICVLYRDGLVETYIDDMCIIQSTINPIEVKKAISIRTPFKQPVNIIF